MLTLLGGVEVMEHRGHRDIAGAVCKLPTDGSENPLWAKMGVTHGETYEDDKVWRKATCPPGWELKPENRLESKLYDDRGRARAVISFKATGYDYWAHSSITPRFSIGRFHPPEPPQPELPEPAPVLELRRNLRYGERGNGPGCWGPIDEYGRPLRHDEIYIERRAPPPPPVVKLMDISLQMEVKDCGKQIFLSKKRRLPNYHRDFDGHVERRDALEPVLRKECEMWLRDQGFPDWQDRGAYWE